MESFDYKSPVRIRFGNGELHELGAEIGRLGCRRVLLVFNKGPFRENGLYEEVRANIAAKGIAVLGMGDIDSNPRLASVREGAQACRREKADGVVAVGGGSAMDCSKVIAAAALSPRDPWEHIWGPKAPFVESLPTVFVPTIAATGTETNPWAVIFDEENRWKNAVTAGCLYAKLVLADPQAMRTVPPRLTVWGAMDILSHTFEFYFNGYHRSIFQNRFSEAIIHSVMECLDILSGDPQDLRARGELWWASVMAWGGLTWLGREAPDMACHDLAEGFVPFYDTHHGATLGAITPRWMRFLVERGGGRSRRSSPASRRPSSACAPPIRPPPPARAWKPTSLAEEGRRPGQPGGADRARRCPRASWPGSSKRPTGIWDVLWAGFCRSARRRPCRYCGSLAARCKGAQGGSGE